MTAVTRTDHDPSDSAAAYYDLLAAAHGPAALPSVSYFASHARRTDRVLDIGAGTGRIALAIAEQGNRVYCVEPSAAMRAVLLAKLATSTALRDRVTVVPGAAPVFDLPGRFDYAYLAGVMQYLPGENRPLLFDTVVRHLRHGATLALDMIGGAPGSGWPTELVGDIAVGESTYALHCEATPVGLSALRMTLDYSTTLDGRLLSATRVERVRHFHSPQDTVDDLEAAGFTVIGGSATTAAEPPADGGTLLATLDHRHAGAAGALVR
jgi:SAM-dependent methyltransferase